MGRTLCKEFPPADRILDMAGELCGQPLKQYCWQGPEQILARTDILQPALTAITLGCTRLLQESGLQPDTVAGHSLGEFSALYAAGVLTLEDTLRLVIERGKLMHGVSQGVAGGMIAVKGLKITQVEEIAASLPTDSRVEVANYNAPDQVVLSGKLDGLGAAENRIRAFGGDAVYLNVSGPWHTSLLQDAAHSFAAFLDSITFRPPQTAIYFNTKGSVESDPWEIRALVARQLVSPVHWSRIIQSMIKDEVRTFLEVGPGKVLRGLLRKIWPDITAYTMRGIDSARCLEYVSRDRMALAGAASGAQRIGT
jgi:[acyl-carrier-protein] S-malonyltransferase